MGAVTGGLHEFCGLLYGADGKVRRDLCAGKQLRYARRGLCAYGSCSAAGEAEGSGREHPDEWNIT